MKFFLAFFIALTGFTTTTQAATLSFHKSVNRLVGPVFVADVVAVENNNEIGQIHWPKKLRGWVSQAQIDSLLSSKGHASKQDVWSGPRRVWVEWCYKPEAKMFNDSAKSIVKKLIEESGLIYGSSESQKEEDIPCVAEPFSSFSWESARAINSRVIEAKIVFELTNGNKELRNFSIGYTARVLGMSTASVSRKNEALKGLDMIEKEVTWTGREVLQDQKRNGYRLVKSLKPKTILRRQHIELIPDVSGGSRVAINVENGAVKITAKGKAVTSGNIGQTIKIRMEGSDVTTDAVITSKGVVSVSV